MSSHRTLRTSWSSTAWARAQGVTRLAMANVVPSLTTDVLWYHADYVAPSWGHRLSFVEKIGHHGEELNRPFPQGGCPYCVSRVVVTHCETLAARLSARKEAA